MSNATHTMTRRELLQRTGLASSALALEAAAWPTLTMAAAASQPRMQNRSPRLGFLDLGTRGSGGTVPAFVERMREYGWIEGETIEIEWRYAEGRAERLPELAAELARLPLDAIVAGGGRLAAEAAARATRTVPIVMANGQDAVEAGLVANLARPEGNVTGVLSIFDELNTDRVHFFHAAFPAVQRVAVLWNADSPQAMRAYEQTQRTNAQVGWTLVPFVARDPAEIDTALAAIRSARVDGLLVLMDPLMLGQRARSVAFAAEARLPAAFPDRPFAADGGLLAVGQSGPGLYRRTATYVDLLLRGARPADLPVVQPDEGYRVVNMATVRAQGLPPAPAAMVQATELIF